MLFKALKCVSILLVAVLLSVGVCYSSSAENSDTQLDQTLLPMRQYFPLDPDVQYVYEVSEIARYARFSLDPWTLDGRDFIDRYSTAEFTYRTRGIPESSLTQFELVRTAGNDSVSGPVFDANSYYGRIEQDGHLTPIFREHWLGRVLRFTQAAGVVDLWPEDGVSLGQEWECIERWRSDNGWEVDLTGKAAAIQSIIVFDTAWDDCLRLEYTFRFQTPSLWRLIGAETKAVFKLTTWHAPDVGIVRGVLSLQDVESRSAWGQQLKQLERAELVRVELISRNNISSLPGPENDPRQDWPSAVSDGAPPWPMFGHDVKRTGRSPYTGPQTANIKWKEEIGLHIFGSPAIGSDGTIYFTCYGDDKVFSVDQAGNLQGWHSTGRSKLSSPTIGPDGSVYVGSTWRFCALSPSLELKWTLSNKGVMSESSAVSKDGAIYLASGDDNVYAIDHSGEVIWQSPLETKFLQSATALADDGTVYVCSRYDEGNLYALDPYGKLKWTYTTGRCITGSPSIAEDGTVIVCAWNDAVVAVNPDGALKWLCETDASMKESAAIALDGTCYAGSEKGVLYAIDTRGNIKWTFSGHAASADAAGTDAGFSTPVVGADGLIYVTSFDGYLYCLNPDGTLKWEHEADKHFSSSAAIGSDGTLYIGMDDALVAFGDD